MKNILVPTDFSETAKNAAIYALQLAGQTGTPKVILFHAYQYPMIIDPMVPVVPIIDEAQLRKNSEDALEKWKQPLLSWCPPDCALETNCEFALLHNGLDEVCKALDATIIVMGITGGGFIEENLIGSNTLSVAKHSTYPVIIVPTNAVFKSIERIMLVSDFDKADKNIPVESVRKILLDTKAKLLVFNTTTDEGGVDASSTENAGNGFAMHTLLEDLHPEYHFSQEPDFTEAVNHFAMQEKVDMVISVPQKLSFFESLFSADHTRMLAFHTHIPLMVVHD